MALSVLNSVAGAARRAIGGSSGVSGRSPYDIPRPMPALIDPKNPSSELQPQDFRFVAEEPNLQEKRILQDCEKEWKEAREAQVHQHQNWFNSWTFYRGEQWRTWDRASNRWLDMRPGPNQAGHDPYRRSRSYNRIQPYVCKTLSKATTNAPTSTVAPLTPSQGDIGAAREARSVVEHVDRKHDAQEQLVEACEWAMEVGAPCYKIYWDPTLPALIPILGPDGQVMRVVEVPDGGDICREIVSPFEWFPDPKAKRFDKCGYVMHAQVVPLTFVQQRYRKGWSVKPDAHTSDQSGIEARMARITGDDNRTGHGKPDGVLLIEKWERRSPRYKMGRLITWANGVLLHYAEEWPDGDGTKFPLVPFYYKKSVGSVYGQNAVSPLIDGQILINKALSRMEEWCDESSWFIATPKGGETGPDAFKVTRDRLATKVFYNQGFKPDFMATPPMAPDFGILATAADNFLRDNIGVHEVSDGRAPAGVDAGVAIQLLQQSDDTQLAPFTRNISAALCEVAERVIEVARNKYLEPRLMMVADSSLVPGQAHTQAVMFRDLAQGRVVVAPGTATTENPTVRQQKILDMASKGMFTPQALPATIALLKMLGFEDSDKLTDDLTAALEAQLAQQPSPADLQAQQQAAEAAQAQAKQQADQQHMAEMQALADHNEQFKSDLQMKHDAQMAAIQNQHAEGMAQFNATLQAHLKTIPSVALKGSMGSTSTPSAEEAAGLAPDSQAEIKAANAQTPAVPKVQEAKPKGKT
jgi:hypothetical protein